MSQQATASLIAMGVALLVLFIAIFAIPSPTGFFGKMMTLLIAVLIFIPIIFVQAYSINCMVEGNCNVFSWIVAAIVIFISIMYVIVAIRSIYVAHKQPEQQQPKQTTTIQIQTQQQPTTTQATTTTQTQTIAAK